jgi:protein TonB
MRRSFAALVLVLLNCALLAAQVKVARVRVSEDYMQKQLVKKVNPDYPPQAREARIQGTVILTIHVTKAGDVESVQLYSGHPMLAPAAIEAVKQWKYKPYLLNQVPVEVETQVQVNFTLAQ